jgi:hypothetical protein
VADGSTWVKGVRHGRPGNGGERGYKHGRWVTKERG